MRLEGFGGGTFVITCAVPEAIWPVADTAVPRPISVTPDPAMSPNEECPIWAPHYLFISDREENKELLIVHETITKNGYLSNANWSVLSRTPAKPIGLHTLEDHETGRSPLSPSL